MRFDGPVPIRVVAPEDGPGALTIAGLVPVGDEERGNGVAAEVHQRAALGHELVDTEDEHDACGRDRAVAGEGCRERDGTSTDGAGSTLRGEQPDDTPKSTGAPDSFVAPFVEGSTAGPKRTGEHREDDGDEHVDAELAVPPLGGTGFGMSRGQVQAGTSGSRDEGRGPSTLWRPPQWVTAQDRVQDAFPTPSVG